MAPKQDLPNPNALPQPPAPPVNPVAPSSTLHDTLEPSHAAILLRYMDAVSRIYTELQGSSAHERLQKAKEDLHQCYLNGEGVFETLKAELEALTAAAEGRKDPGAPEQDGE